MQFVSWNINFKAKTVFYWLFLVFCLNFDHGWSESQCTHENPTRSWLKCLRVVVMAGLISFQENILIISNYLPAQAAVLETR